MNTYVKILLGVALIFPLKSVTHAADGMQYSGVDVIEQTVGEREEDLVLIYGDAARVICSMLGFQLDQYEGQSFIASKGGYTCQHTVDGKNIAGHIVNYSGKIRNLEGNGYQ